MSAKVSFGIVSMKAKEYRVALVAISDEANGPWETILYGKDSQALFRKLSAWLKSNSGILFDDLYGWIDPREMDWFVEEDDVEEMTVLDVEKRFHTLLDARAAERVVLSGGPLVMALIEEYCRNHGS